MTIPVEWMEMAEKRVSRGQVLAHETGITVHRSTSVYINRNKVERRLGTVAEVYPRNILLTYS
jgi:hypothetical protein